MIGRTSDVSLLNPIIQGVFGHRQWRFPCQRREVQTGQQNPYAMSCSRARDFFLVHSLSIARHQFHIFFVAQGASGVNSLTTPGPSEALCPTKTDPYIFRTIAHSSPSLLFPSSQRTSTLFTSTPILSLTTPSTKLMQTSLPDETKPCEDPWKVSFGSLAKSHTSTGYEPNRLAEEVILPNTELRPSFFHTQSTTSAYDSAESIATRPPESDWDDEHIRTMLASPLYLQEREASADRSRVHHSLRENTMSTSSHFREKESTGTCRIVFTQLKVEYVPMEKLSLWNVKKFW